VQHGSSRQELLTNWVTVAKLACDWARLPAHAIERAVLHPTRCFWVLPSVDRRRPRDLGLLEKRKQPRFTIHEEQDGLGRFQGMLLRTRMSSRSPPTPRQAPPRIGPCRTSAMGPARWPGVGKWLRTPQPLIYLYLPWGDSLPAPTRGSLERNRRKSPSGVSAATHISYRGVKTP